MPTASHWAFGSGSYPRLFICSLKKSHFITFQALQLRGELQEINEKFMSSVSNWHFCFFFPLFFFNFFSKGKGSKVKGCEWGREWGEWVSSAMC